MHWIDDRREIRLIFIWIKSERQNLNPLWNIKLWKFTPNQMDFNKLHIDCLQKCNKKKQDKLIIWMEHTKKPTSCRLPETKQNKTFNCSRFMYSILIKHGLHNGICYGIKFVLEIESEKLRSRKAWWMK